jgi:hypothetical protein
MVAFGMILAGLVVGGWIAIAGRDTDAPTSGPPPKAPGATPPNRPSADSAPARKPDPHANADAPAFDAAALHRWVLWQPDRAAAERFLKARPGNAAALLAVGATLKDPLLLAEAKRLYPDSPEVQWMAGTSRESAPEERIRWLAAWQKTEPKNALPWFLEAFEQLSADNLPAALPALERARSLELASSPARTITKEIEDFYSREGMPVDLAWMRSLNSLPPGTDTHAGGQRTLIRSIQSAQASGQPEIALELQEAGLWLANLNERRPGQTLMESMVNRAFETGLLRTLDSEAKVGATEQTVRARLQELDQEKAATQTVVHRASEFTIQFHRLDERTRREFVERVRLFGEVEAHRWIAPRLEAEPAPQ